MFVLGGSGSESGIHSMNCLKVCFFNQEEKYERIKLFKDILIRYKYMV